MLTKKSAVHRPYGIISDDSFPIPTIIYVLLGALFAFSLYMQFANGSAGDKIWQLFATRRWLQGKRLYVDIYFDINSPALNFIYAIPEYISLHTGIADSVALVAFGLGVIAFCLTVCTHIIGFSPQFTSARMQRLFAGLVAFILIFLTIPPFFFHREQIFFILILPYILRWMPSVERRPLPGPLQMIIGSMAGVGFCMKPHCLVVLLAIQLLYVFRTRSLRILSSRENYVIYIVNALYILSVIEFTPTYLTVVLPMALETYSSYNEKQYGLFFFAIAFVILGFAFVDFRLRYATPYRKDIFYLLGICGAYAAYALVNNGWAYTYNPLYSMLLLSIGLVLLDYTFLLHVHQAGGMPVKQFRFGIRACIFDYSAAVIVVFLIYFHALTSHCEGKYCGTDEALLKEVRLPDRMRSFGSITIDYMPWIKLGNAGAPWETRFDQLWMLPKLLVAGPRFALSHPWIMNYLSAAFAQDLTVNKPEVVFVDDTNDFITVHKDIDLAGYFSTHDDFRQAWKLYYYSHTVDNCIKLPNGHEVKERCSYKVYLRKAS